MKGNHSTVAKRISEGNIQIANHTNPILMWGQKEKKVENSLSTLSDPMRVAEENQTLSLNAMKYRQNDDVQTFTLPDDLLSFRYDGNLADNKTITNVDSNNSRHTTSIDEIKEHTADLSTSLR